MIAFFNVTRDGVANTVRVPADISLFHRLDDMEPVQIRFHNLTHYWIYSKQVS
jgi:hypothetical protein